MDRGQTIAVEIADIALPNNYGVARKDGFVIFVPGGVTGDRVKVKILRKNKRYAYADVVEMLAPSPFRVNPRCQSFGACGGCVLQNIVYEKQLEIKQNYLFQTLKRIGGIDTGGIRVGPVISSPDTYFYRNKLELSFGERGGETVLGLRERVSPFSSYEGTVIPLGGCVISSPVVEKVIPVVAEYAKKHSLTAYNPLTGRGYLRHLILRESKSIGEFMAIIETRVGDLPGVASLWRTLQGLIPEITSLFVVINNQPGDSFHPEKTVHLAGKTYIEERLNDLTFRVFPESFFQPNTRSAEILHRKIADLTQLRLDENVLGLYCGTGPVEIFLSRYAKEVIGVDSESANIINARENCVLNEIKNCLFYEGKMELVLKKMRLAKIDLLVVDPPRGGISREGLDHVFKISPQRIAYVSCNPSTLARDLKDLRARGYDIVEIAAFDFFPHTPHVETLVALSRS